MTDERFCELDSAITGELIDNINQLTHASFNGIELKEYVEHFIEADLNKAVQDAYKTCTSICEEISRKHWADYKRGKNRADLHYQGLSMGAEECEEAIKKRSTK